MRGARFRSSRAAGCAQGHPGALGVAVGGAVHRASGAAASGTLTVSIIDYPVTLLTSQTSNSTITFSNIPNGSANTFYVEVVNRSSYTVTFSGVTWDGGSAPTLASGTGKTVLEFYSRDGGTTIYGKARFATIA